MNYSFLPGVWSRRLLMLAFFVPSFDCSALDWTARTIEFTVNPGAKEAAGVFHFVNAGGAPVTIASVWPGCDCTAAELVKRTYAPGEAGEIKAVFTIGDRVGRQEKLIYVTTDSAPADPIVLTLRVTVPERLVCSPRLLHWCTAGPLDEKSVTISSVGPRRIASVEAAPGGPSTVTSRVETVEAGKKYRISIKPASVAKAANLSLDFVAHFVDDTVVQRFTVYLAMRDLPDWQSR